VIGSFSRNVAVVANHSTSLKGYKPPNSTAEYQSIPLSKIEDFGVHADAYYQLDIQIFKSKLDDKLLGLLWNKYWVNTLSQSPIISVTTPYLLKFNTSD
jgi:hypothetical protein